MSKLNEFTSVETRAGQPITTIYFEGSEKPRVPYDDPELDRLAKLVEEISREQFNLHRHVSRMTDGIHDRLQSMYAPMWIGFALIAVLAVLTWWNG